MTPGIFPKICHPLYLYYAFIFNHIIQYLHQTTKIPLKLVFLELTRLPILEPLAFVYVPDSNNGSNNIDKLRKMQTAYYFSLLFSRKISDKKKLIPETEIKLPTYIFKFFFKCHPIVRLTLSANQSIAIVWSIPDQIFNNTVHISSVTW